MARYMAVCLLPFSHTLSEQPAMNGLATKANKRAMREARSSHSNRFIFLPEQDCFTSKRVDLMSYRFVMQRIHAVAYSALMIKEQSFRNISDQEFTYSTMSYSAFFLPPSSSISVPISGSNPKPTWCVLVGGHNAANNALLESLRQACE